MKILAGLLLALTIYGQDSLTLQAGVPPGVRNDSISVSATNRTGADRACYWVIAVYPIGKVNAAGPSCIDRLSASSIITVSWGSTGATTYDVLRYDIGLTLPTTGNILVTNTGATSVSTTLAAVLTAYTVASAPAQATATLKLDNKSYSAKRIVADTTIDAPGLLVNGTAVAAQAPLTTNLIGGNGTGGLSDSGVTKSGSNYTFPGTVSTGDGTAAGEVKLFELQANGSNYVSLLAADSIASTLRLKVDGTDPNGGFFTCAAKVGDTSTCSWGSTTAATRRYILLPLGGLNGAAAGFYWGWYRVSDATGADAGWSITLPNTGTPTIQNRLYIPIGFDGAQTSYLRVTLRWAADPTGSNTKLGVAILCSADGANYFGSIGTPTYQTLTPTAADQFKHYDLVAPISACAAGNMLDIQLIRDNTVGSNFAGGVYLQAAALSVVAN